MIERECDSWWLQCGKCGREVKKAFANRDDAVEYLEDEGLNNGWRGEPGEGDQWHVYCPECAKEVLP